MTAGDDTGVIANPWQALRRHTSARIALGRAGVSLPTAPQLAFQLAHAQARDAVHHALDVPALSADLGTTGLRNLTLRSAAPDRATYLRRPDLGRMLDAGSRERLQVEAAGPAADGSEYSSQPDKSHTANQAEKPNAATKSGETYRFDLAFVVADGLSAQAVQRHAVPLLTDTLQRLRASPAPWRIAPIAVVTQGRVAIGDDIGACLQAALVVVLIGERPGLSSPDSLGIYVTWNPRPGRLDSQRNCISNVRPEGLPHAEAAHRLCLLLEEGRRRRITGIALKDESDAPALLAEPRSNFLIARKVETPGARPK